MNRRKLVGAAFIIAVVTMAGVAAVMSTSGTEMEVAVRTSVAASVDEPAPGSAALRAYLDPETGELAVGVAPAAELELDPDTENALRRDDEGLVQVRHADGSVSMDLQGRYQSVSIARVNAGGTITVCTESAEGAKHALDGKTPNHAPEVK